MLLFDIKTLALKRCAFFLKKKVVSSLKGIPYFLQVRKKSNFFVSVLPLPVLD